MNAYVGLLNRSLRAVQSLDRYKSWVNMKTGPTGRESIVYGLYRGLRHDEGSRKRLRGPDPEPLLPELDAAMRDYIAANAALGPILNEASAYYERDDYKTDRMAGGKALHVEDHRRRRAIPRRAGAGRRSVPRRKGEARRASTRGDRTTGGPRRELARRQCDDRGRGG